MPTRRVLRGPQLPGNEAIEHLPSQAMIVGDANFGIFSVAYAGAPARPPRGAALDRRASPAFGGGTPLRDGTDRRIQWRPSRDEVDLRSLKGTLRLEELTCTSQEMVAKELEVAMPAYNLVRGVMYLTAQKAGLEPTCLQFHPGEECAAVLLRGDSVH